MRGLLALVLLFVLAVPALANHGLNRFQQRQVNQANRAVHRNVQRQFNNHHVQNNVQFVPVHAHKVQFVPVQAAVQYVPVQAAPVQYAPACNAQAVPAFNTGGCHQFFPQNNQRGVNY